MKHSISAGLLACLLIFLAACTVRSKATSDVNSANLLVHQTATPLKAHSTSPVPTNSPTVTPAPTLEPTVEYQKECITTIEDKIPGDLNLDGALLMQGGSWGTEYLNSMYHFDLMSLRKSPLPSTADDIALSPDGKWLAYIDVSFDAKGNWKDRVLQVVNAEGRHVDMSYWRVSWQYLVGWQDEKRLLLHVPGYHSGNYIVLNPFTMEYQVLNIEIPVLLEEDKQEEHWGYRSSSRPSPSLSYWAVNINDHSPWAVNINDHSPRWQLLRGNGWQLIWKGGDYVHDVSWAPNEQYFVVGDHSTRSDANQRSYQLLRINLDGSSIPITNTIGPGEWYSWSPDSRYLAAWLVFDTSNSSYEAPMDLFIIDVSQPKMIDLCIKIKRSFISVPSNLSPVWSPDGRFLAIGVERIVEKYEYWDETAWDTVLIDVQKNRAYTLVKNASPQVWMRKPKLPNP